jgi:hypothetical protein
MKDDIGACLYREVSAKTEDGLKEVYHYYTHIHIHTSTIYRNFNMCAMVVV